MQQESNRTVTDETKLPHGLAMSQNNWRSFCLAFARIYSLMESKSADETKQFFGIAEEEWDGDGTYSDNGNLHTDILADPDLLEASWQKANLIARSMEREEKKKMKAKTPKPTVQKRTSGGIKVAAKKGKTNDIYTESEDSESDMEEIFDTDEDEKEDEAAASSSQQGTMKKKAKTDGKNKTNVAERRPFPPFRP